MSTDYGVHFLVADVKRKDEKLDKFYSIAESKIIKEGSLKCKSGTTYANPIHKCLAYLAKHNADLHCGYSSLKIYSLSKIPLENQSQINFKAIRYLFLHFQHPSLAKQVGNIRNPQDRQRLLEQGLLSFTYHCDHELVLKKAAEVLSTMSHIID